MKANPSIGILRLFRDLGLHVDASSDYEVERALRAGFAPEQIQLTSQAPSRRLEAHVRRGVLYNACSLYQLESFGKVAPGARLSVRLNPGLGSGGTNRTNTGGGLQLRDLARAPGRGEADRRPVPTDDRPPPQPHRLGIGPGGLEAGHPDDAR